MRGWHLMSSQQHSLAEAPVLGQVRVEVVVLRFGGHGHVDLKRRLPKRIWFVHASYGS